uniref:Outer membrane autotransporter barrel domain-containing protein n=1 Tax=Candidatus Kentrum sp. FW TaxID=2126338 RepID=A0A450TSQ7_9GAMM|nr:MAG: outer membrane autotransporter barrel domain-containing protein [Candidatus Kentron sp. FW]
MNANQQQQVERSSEKAVQEKSFGKWLVLGISAAAFTGMTDKDHTVFAASTNWSSASVYNSDLQSQLGDISPQEVTAAANAVNALANPQTPGDIALQTAFNAALTAGGPAAAEAIQQINVQVDTMGASTTVNAGTSRQAVGTTSARLASLRTGDQYAGGLYADSYSGNVYSGFASGDLYYGASKAFWVRPFGGWTDQDERGGIEGYNADTYGIAIGADMPISDRFRIGASFAYSNTDVKGEGAGASNSDIDGYHLTVYGDYTTDGYYLQSMVSYARSNNDTSEQVLTAVRTASYDSDQYAASIGGGKPIQFQNGLFITPKVDLTWTRVNTNSYTTSGAGSLNLNINPDDADVVVSSLGAQFHTIVDKSNGRLVPSAYAGITYDLVNDDAQSVNSFTGGGSSFVAQGHNAPELGGAVGLGLSYNRGMFSIGAKYNLNFKSDYQSHAAMVEGNWKF